MIKTLIVLGQSRLKVETCNWNFLVLLIWRTGTLFVHYDIHNYKSSLLSLSPTNHRCNNTNNYIEGTTS